MSQTTETAEKRSDEVRLPNSRKVYVEGAQTGVRVPFREITQNVTKTFDGRVEENQSVRVYDTSGVWDDPSVQADVREGLPALIGVAYVLYHVVDERRRGLPFRVLIVALLAIHFAVTPPRSDRGIDVHERTSIDALSAEIAEAVGARNRASS